MSVTIFDLSVPEPDVLQIIARNDIDNDLTFFVQSIAGVVDFEADSFSQVYNQGANVIILEPIINGLIDIQELQTELNVITTGMVTIQAGSSIPVRFRIPIKQAQRLIKSYDVAFRAGTITPATQIDEVTDQFVINNHFTPPRPEKLLQKTLLLSGTIISGYLFYSLFN